MLTEAEFERRKPVWSAFSEFWLDTQLEKEDIQRIADAAIASGYSLTELHDIYLYEVAPVVYRNGWEWSGFDPEWLHAETRKRAEHRSFWLWFWTRALIGRWLLTWLSWSHWVRVAFMVWRARRAGN